MHANLVNLIYMDTIQILGLFAATLTAISFFPQAYKVIRMRNTQGISLLMYVILVVAWNC